MAAQAMSRGKFITFEGIDGAGKSSHLDMVCDLVRARGHGVERTFEPGGTPFGQKIRELVLGHPSQPLAEALAMFAARSAHVHQLIQPSLDAGVWVVCDRFSDSTYAYQCGGHLVPREHVEGLERIVHPGLQPDATFLFDIDPATAAARQQSRSRDPDRFESEQREFFVRVRNAYLDRARENPRRIHVIDASRGLEEVRESVRRSFEAAFA
jgi:dTMP kinase